MGKCNVLVPLILAGVFTAAARAAELTLVENGRATASIVISAQAAAELAEARKQAAEAATKPADAQAAAAPQLSNAAAAARELQHYLRKISGAELPIVADDQPAKRPRVLVGRSRLTTTIAGLEIPSGVTGNLRDEGFIVSCKDDTLVLAGNDEGPYYGTRYAVCELLERLGVRWIMPGEFGEVVPQSRTIRVPEQSVVQRPDFVIRGVVDDLEWQIHNKLNTRIHAWAGAVGDNTLAGSGAPGYLGGPEVYEQHPEWFALNEDGKTRNPRLVCMTHPDAVRLVAKKCK